MASGAAPSPSHLVERLPSPPQEHDDAADAFERLQSEDEALAEAIVRDEQPTHDASNPLVEEGAEKVNRGLTRANTDNGSRKINFNKFCAKPFHKGKSRKELRAIFDRLDASKDGVLDFEEFEQYRFGQTSAKKKERAHKKAGVGPLKLIFGIGPEDDVTGMPSSSLIYPLSWFGLAWIGLNVVFLAYIAVATPPMIAFYWLDDACIESPTLWFDFALDLFFLVDIIMNFNIGYIQMGLYVDNRWEVARHYFRGYFVFDCVTSFPVSFFEVMALADCAEEQGGNENQRSLRFVRAIKPLRLFKLARIFKLAKGGIFVDTFMDFFNISPKHEKTLFVTLKFLMTLHMVTCAWWLWKVIFEKEGDSQNFLNDLPWGSGRQAPKLDSHEGKMEAYVVSMYLVTMTLTTVGYGDISAESTPERIGYILLFIGGAFVWGNLLASIDEIHGASTAREKRKLDKVQETLDFLIENECPQHIRSRIIQWTRFREDHGVDVETKSTIISDLPQDLQQALVRHLYAQNVSRVPVLAYIESVDDGDAKIDEVNEEFLSNIFLQLEYKAYPPLAALVNFSDPADRMLILVTGKVIVEFDHPVIQRETLNLDEGDFIGDMALLKEDDWAKSTCFHFPPAEVDEDDECTEIMVTAEALHYVVVLQLTQKAFQEMLERASAVTRAAVEDFHLRWKRTRQVIISEENGGLDFDMRILMQWGDVGHRYLKKLRQQKAVEENHQWKAMRSKKLSLNRPQEHSDPSVDALDGAGKILGKACDTPGTQKLESTIKDMQGRQLEMQHSMDKLLASHNALLAICRSNSELLRHLVTSGDDQLPNQPERTARTQKLIAAAEAASLA